MLKARKTKTKKPKSKLAEINFTGEEPVFKSKPTRMQLVKALNWYNYFNNIKDTKKWILEYMEKNGYSKEDINAYKVSNSSTITQTKASIARMLTRGVKIEHDLDTHIRDIIDQHLESNTKVSKTSAYDNYNELICDIDIRLDKFYNSGYKTIINFAEIVKDRKPADYKEAMKFYSELAEEVETFEEGYEHLSKRQKNKYIQNLLGLVEQIKLATTVTKRRKVTERKPITKKVKPVEQIFAKMKYAKDSKEFNISSFDPVKMVDSSIIWVYDIKYKKLVKYVALEGQTLTVKGTTLQNVDSEKSMSKTVRKPLEVVPFLLTNTTRAINKMFSELTTKTAVPNNRTSDNTLLLRYFK